MSVELQDVLIKIEGLAEALVRASGDSKAALQKEYLDMVWRYMADQGRGEALALPLLDVIELLDQGALIGAPKQPERRAGVSDGSDQLMAQVAAVIDILISAGYSLDHACQIVTRQMMARQVHIPTGGDARAWRNVQAWRHKLLNSKREGVVWRTYATYKDELMSSYGARVGEAAAREAIWDRRARAKAAASA